GGSISRDGKLMVYSSDRSGEGNFDLWLKQVPEGAPVRLTHEPGDAFFSSFSPDGTQIVFSSDRDGGGIYKMPALGGGLPSLLAHNGIAPRFSPDGKQVLFLRPERPLGFVSLMLLIPATGGEAKPYRPDYRATSADWTPDGNHILFAGVSHPQKAGERL